MTAREPAPAAADMAVLAWCPFPSEAEARAVSATLLDEGLVACANIVGPMVSLYRWQGERGGGREWGVLFKASAAVRSRLVARLDQLHSYQTPAIMTWDATAATPATAHWLRALGGVTQAGV